MEDPGDLDGDGIDDFVVGDPFGPQSGGPLLGEVRALSGQDGSLLYQITGTTPGDGFGTWIEPLGDLDGDGAKELAIVASSSDGASLTIVSGRSGAPRYTWVGHSPWDIGGGAICNLGDVDSDGADDLAIGAPLAGDWGYVAIVSGSSGSTLRVLLPPTWGKGFGEALARSADMDGDGVDELIAGQYESCTVHFVSPVTGKVLHSLTGPPVTRFGAKVSPAGDVDGDGVADVLVSALGAWHGPNTTGSVYVFSGATSTQLHRVDAEEGQYDLGIQIGPYGDLDADGRDDFMLAYSLKWNGTWFDGGELYVCSGLDASVLYSDPVIGRFRPVDDINHDGVKDYLRGGAAEMLGVHTNKVVLIGVPSPVASCSQAVGSPEGCEPVLDWSGAPSLSTGSDLVFRAWTTPPNRRCLLFWGLDSQTTPFADGLLCIKPPLLRMAPGKTSMSPWVCGGEFIQPFTKQYMSAMGLTAGMSVHVQFLGLGSPLTPTGVSISNSIWMTVWP